MKKADLLRILAIMIISWCSAWLNLNANEPDDACDYIDNFEKELSGFTYDVSALQGLDQANADFFVITSSVIRGGEVTKENHKKFWRAVNILENGGDLIKGCEIPKIDGSVEFLREFYISALATHANRKITHTKKLDKILAKPVKILPRGCFYAVDKKHLLADPSLSSGSFARFYAKELDGVKRCFEPYNADLESIANGKIGAFGSELSLSETEAIFQKFQKASRAKANLDILFNPNSFKK